MINYYMIANLTVCWAGLRETIPLEKGTGKGGEKNVFKMQFFKHHGESQVGNTTCP